MSSTEKARTFLGMNIVGDYSTGRDRKPQRPVSDLAPLFDAVFAGGVITGVQWDQYTPYFNDGDPCVFSANDYSMKIRLANGDWIETDSYDDTDPMATLIGHKVYGKDVHGGRDYSSCSFQGPHVVLAEAVDQLKSALGGGEFDDVLVELFGDHATVTVPASGDIEVETAEHD